jgi:hypothetical protein
MSPPIRPHSRRLQQTIQSLQESISSPDGRRSGRGRNYHDIHISGSGRNHFGDNYFGDPTLVASLENLSGRLEEMATAPQVDRLVSLVEKIKIVSSDSEPMNNDPAIFPINVYPSVESSNQQITSLSLSQLTKVFFQRLFEALRTELNALLLMLLWTIPNFRTFVRTLATFARQPSMLLDSNISFVDALNREVSLPHQFFGKWPYMLAHLQCQFTGMPGEAYIANNDFDLFRESRGPQYATRIPLDQWEDFVTPGTRIFMSILLEDMASSPQTCPYCLHSWQETMSIGKWSKW